MSLTSHHSYILTGKVILYGLQSSMLYSENPIVVALFITMAFKFSFEVSIYAGYLLVKRSDLTMLMARYEQSFDHHRIRVRIKKLRRERKIEEKSIMGTCQVFSDLRGPVCPVGIRFSPIIV